MSSFSGKEATHSTGTLVKLLPDSRRYILFPRTTIEWVPAALCPMRKAVGA
jgi:hypothetical protein